jgi:hypothetical protein
LSRSSSSTRTPLARSWAARSLAAPLSVSRFIPLMTIGTMTTWMGATRGGRTRPVSSEWTMTITPIERVVKPHDVCQGICFWPCLSSYSILNILPKFLPRLCEVAPWMARPVAGT